MKLIFKKINDAYATRNDIEFGKNHLRILANILKNNNGLIYEFKNNITFDGLQVGDMFFADINDQTYNEIKFERINDDGTIFGRPTD